MRVYPRFLTAAAVLLGAFAAPGGQPASPSPPSALMSPQEAIREIVTSVRGGSFLGVGVAEINAERARELKLKEEYGVEITRVEKDSPAEKAGLKKGDVVLDYNGQRVQGVEQFVRLVRETPAGRTAKLSISRDGQTQTLEVTIGTRKSQWFQSGREGSVRVVPRIEIPEIYIPDIPRAFTSWRSAMLGVEAESLESQLAEYFGVKEGVLIRSVIKDSAAAKAGLRAGDVILKVGDTKVATPREVSSAVRSLRSKKSFPITVMREKREVTVTVTVEEDQSRRDTSPRRMIVHSEGIRL